METIKIVIADDERYSRDELKHLLSEFSSIQIIGEADTGEAAVMKTLQLQPDVVFLDVEMPKMNGMEAAKSLMELKKVPLIVFATAYPQFAAEAFRYEAIDYLLKPYDEEQLKQTVQRMEKLLIQAKGSEKSIITGKLAVEVEGEIIYLEPKDILYMYRDDKVTKIITRTKSFDTKTPLKDLESRLGPYCFFRIHKSYLVNLDYVAKLTPWFNGAYQLELEGTEEMLSVSRNYVKSLRERLEI
ncbi:LytTR family DNA-binding domain-containing protein [Metabacillus idriensis]|uniref:Response regulator n=1 Tax=Metabacillus idriensis TaxID=324768 RepID=A0A6I2MCQ9_9BACI|nr:LytTR family DNA-binding domain-containing protein [Metabacillus idriensis]MCM3598291.1 LytTR family DNA-binding domain-containing protein [Metabacillus idriensis]MRX55087.1 response regulator [Metabacillus idriensis]OHR71700.1 DNA-binding response regulator [Bacillus sp. HMSC76G11]